jgi:hypothetical protein
VTDPDAGELPVLEMVATHAANDRRILERINPDRNQAVCDRIFCPDHADVSAVRASSDGASSAARTGRRRRRDRRTRCNCGSRDHAKNKSVHGISFQKPE